ncbi:MAG TPA: hypothetical protein VHC98_03260 [Candidatus Saccharimonadales bacterium]|nr:hypothetical protein [Candidatus Saccharimonadales bacterium]
MDDSIAILGRQPALGLAELESLYGADAVRPAGSQAARLRLAPCSVDVARLGGTMKLCKLLTVLDTTKWPAIEQFLIGAAPTQATRMPEGKMHLGLSAYGTGVSPQQLLAAGLKLKKAIHAASGRTVRLVPNKTAELNAAQVLHNQLTRPNGWELVLIRDGMQTIVAQTVSVQDIDAYAARDFGRPKRDARVGMLPPKLAQLLINLAIGPGEFAAVRDSLSGDVCRSADNAQKLRADHGRTTVLDPFCGTGVVLQEALLMGYHAYGTDLEPRMIDYSRTNLAWLAERRRLGDASPELAVGDATTYQWQLPADQPVAVASEAYLGRPFTGRPAPEVLAQTMTDCNLIIKKFLRNVHDQLPAGARLCLALPAWQVRPGEFRHLPLIDQLAEMGYNRVSFERIRDDDLLYYRADQIVARQLLVITRK